MLELISTFNERGETETTRERTTWRTTLLSSVEDSSGTTHRVGGADSMYLTKNKTKL